MAGRHKARAFAGIGKGHTGRTHQNGEIAPSLASAEPRIIRQANATRAAIKLTTAGRQQCYKTKATGHQRDTAQSLARDRYG